MRRFFIIVGIAVGCLVLLLGAGIAALFMMDWNAVRDSVSARATAALGRKVEIRGDLEVAPSLVPQIRAEQVVIGNAPWGSRPEMVRVRELYVAFRIAPLVLGRLEINRLRLVGLDVLLEKSGSRANWRLKPQGAEGAAVEAAAPEERGEFPVVKSVQVEDGRLVFRSANLEEPVEARFESIDVRAGGIGAALHVKMQGAYQNAPFAFEGDLGSPAQLRNESEPYPVDASMAVGETKLAFNGVIMAPLKFKGIRGEMTVEGSDLGELHRLLDLPLAPSPPYRLTGKLEHQGEEWRLRGFAGTIGSSDLSGDIALLTGGDRPKITANVVSKAIDVDDISGFWAGKEDKKRARTAGDTVISDQPFSLEKLRETDVDLRFRGESVKSSGPLLTGLAADLTLDNGLLTLKPLEVGLAEGEVAANLQLNARQDVPRMDADLRIRGIELRRLLEGFGFENAASVGTLRGRAEISTRGGSLHELADAADGDLVLIMEGGRLSNLVLELAALDLQEALSQWASHKEETVNIDCFIAPSSIESGRILAAPWILETSDVIVTVKGTLDLGEEMVELELTPYPKDFSLFNTLSSITVEGDLARRSASVNELEAVGKLVLKTIMAPLMPLLSEEIEEQAKAASPCAKLIGRARRATE